MSKKLVIQFNEKSMYIAHVKTHKDSTQLLQDFTIDFNSKILTDKELNEVDNIAFKLKKELKARKISTKDVVFTINSSRILCRKIDIPKQKNEKAFLELLRAKVVSDKTFPIDIDDYCLAYSYVGTHINNGQRMDENSISTPAKNSSSMVSITTSNDNVVESSSNIDEESIQKEDDSKKKNERKHLFFKNKKENSSKENIEKNSNANNEVPKEKSSFFTLEKTSKEKSTMDIMVYVCPQSMVDSLIAVANYAKLNITNIEYSGNTIYQYVSKNINKNKITGRPIKSDYLLVHINDVNTIVTVVNDGKITQQKSLPLSYTTIATPFFTYHDIFGFDTISEVLSFITDNNFLDTEQDILDMFPKFDKAFLASTEGQLAEEYIKKTQSFVIDELLNMINQLNAILMQCRNDSIRPEIVYYYNERKNFPDIIDTIVHSTKLPVHPIEQVENFESLISYASVFEPIDFSLAINTDKALNHKVNQIILISCGVSIAISLGIIVAYAMKLTEVQIKNTKLQQQIVEANDAKQAYSKYTGFMFAYEDLYKLDKETNSSYLRHFGDVLNEIEEIVPSRDIEISYISASLTDMTFEVSAARKEIVVKFVQGLETLDFVESATYTDIKDLEDRENGKFSSGHEAKATIFVTIRQNELSEEIIEVPEFDEEGNIKSDGNENNEVSEQ